MPFLHLKTLFFRVSLGFLRFSRQEASSQAPTESKLSWRYTPEGQIFNNQSGKLPTDDPPVVARK